MRFNVLLGAMNKVIIYRCVKIIAQFRNRFALVTYKSVIRQVKHLSIQAVIFFAYFNAAYIPFIHHRIHTNPFLVKNSNVCFIT